MESRPEIPEHDGIGRSDLGVGLKEVMKVSLKIGFGFPSCFFFGMMIPLNFEHLDSLSSSTSLFGV
jgi:hypothetical protein